VQITRARAFPRTGCAHCVGQSPFCQHCLCNLSAHMFARQTRAFPGTGFAGGARWAGETAFIFRSRACLCIGGRRCFFPLTAPFLQPRVGEVNWTGPCRDGHHHNVSLPEHSHISSMLKGSAWKLTGCEKSKTVLRLNWWADILRGVNVLSILALSILMGLLCAFAPFEAAPRLSPIDPGFVCSWIERTFDAYKCMRDADSVRPSPRGENAFFSGSARQSPSSPCTRYQHLNSLSSHLTRLPGRTRQVGTCRLKWGSLFTTRGLNEVPPVSLQGVRVKRLCSGLRLAPGYRRPSARIQQLVTTAGVQQGRSSVAAANT
jgi:hypothetical protein